jgi:hypothetical protein
LAAGEKKHGRAFARSPSDDSAPLPPSKKHSYNKKRADFETDAAYDDYLEMVEDIS